MTTNDEVLALLSRQHDRMRELLRRATTCDVAERAERVAELIRFLAAHDGAVLVATRPRGEEPTGHGPRLVSDPEVGEVLELVDDLGPSSEGFVRRLAALGPVLERHVRLEEEDEMPRFLATHVDEDGDRALGVLRTVDELASEDGPVRAAGSGLRALVRESCSVARRRVDAAG
jgi:hypothetical protein